MNALVNVKKVEARQVPKTVEIVSDKQYHDILYSFLQENSEWDGDVTHPRFVYKELINFTRIGQQLGISRQTASRKFQNLVALGLIAAEPDVCGRYFLQLLPKDVAALIPQKTLKLLVNTLSENAISTYIFLLRRYVANDEQPFNFTIEEVKSYLGISVATASNNDVVTNILFVLQRIGLVAYERTRTGYKLLYLTNYLRC